jgi:hypothetical protein
LAIPENKNPEEIYDQFKNQLSNLTEIAGVPLISIKKIQLIKPKIIINPDDTIVNPVRP